MSRTIEFSFLVGDTECGGFWLSLSPSESAELEALCEDVEDGVDIEDICNEFGRKLWQKAVDSGFIQILAYID